MPEHLVAQYFLLQLFEDRFRLELPLDLFFGNRGDEIVEELVDSIVVFHLAPNPHGLAQRYQDFLFDLAIEVVADFLPGDCKLFLACLSRKVIYHCHDLFDRGVSSLERSDDLFFGNLSGAGFNHDQAIAASGHDEIHTALLSLFVGGVDDVLTVQQPDTDAGNRLFEWNFRQGQSGRRASDGKHVRVVVGIGRQHESDHLCFVAPPRWKQRANRSIDDATGQHFLFGRLPLAFEKAAWDPARRVGVLTIVDRERQEVDSFAGTCRIAGRDEDNRVAQPDEHGPVGLLGQLACFNRESARAESEFACMHGVHSFQLQANRQAVGMTTCGCPAG